MKVYHVPGSLTQPKGNISHNGSIKIDGGIKGRISLHAAGNITVGGDIEGANLKAEGDIFIGGTILGTGTNLIEAKGTVNIAGAIEAIEVRAQGDLNINDRINRCVIKTMGRINGRQAIMRDSHATSLAGIILYSVECSSTGASIIRVGTSYVVLEEISRLNDARDRKKSELQHLLNRLGPIIKRAITDRDYGRKMGQDIDADVARARVFNAEAGKIEKNIADVMKTRTQNGVACLSIARAMQKGTQVNAERAFFLATENIGGPFSLIPDRTGSSFIKEKGLLLERVSQ
jgi:uncharacterized protein (DUF342 family)